MSESSWVRKGPCDSCGSRDNCAHYDDGHTFCFGCRKHTGGSNQPREGGSIEPRRIYPMIEDLDFVELRTRGLNLDTCTRWKYGVKAGVQLPGVKGTKSVQVAQYMDKTGQKVVAQHVKFINDDGEKDFRWLGDHSQISLYGMNLWPNPGGKKVVITEGEVDAKSVSQLQGHRFPVYSVPNGASNALKDLGKHIDFLESFEEIVLMFDMDAPGMDATEKCAQLFSPGKVSIAKLPLKDANDMLQAGRGAEVINALFRAEKYKPEGIVYGQSLWDAISDVDAGRLLPFPWDALNDKVKGLRTGQILLMPAGTGVGKSTVARWIASHWHDNYGEKVAIFALEEPLLDTTCELISNKLGRRDIIDLPPEELKPLFDQVMDDGWCLWNHMGCVDWATLEHRFRYFVRVCGCTTIIFDHIMAAVEGQEDADNAVISRAMNRLRSLVGELGIRLIMPTHLKSVEGRAFEEGAPVRLADIKWPALRQYSNKIIAIERDQQGDDQFSFQFRVLKCRGDNGQLGLAGGARWDPKTGAMPETSVIDTGLGAPEKEEEEHAPF